MSVRLKVALALVLLAIALVALWWFFGPEHLFVRATDFVTVTVDDRRVRSDTYTAHPTYDESDAGNSNQGNSYVPRFASKLDDGF